MAPVQIIIDPENNYWPSTNNYRSAGQSPGRWAELGFFTTNGRLQDTTDSPPERAGIGSQAVASGAGRQKNGRG